MRSFIIHMRGDQRRLANAKQLLAVLPDARIADAVIGADVMATTPVAPGTQNTPRYPFVLTPGDVGFFLSHRACWQKIVDQGLDHALIAEDDLHIDPVIWPEVLDLIHSHANSDAYIRIPAKHRERSANDVARRDIARLFLPRVIGLQTILQVVGQNAARRLLAASETLDRPVDAFVQMHWQTGQPVHTIFPSGVRELSDDPGGSTIQKKSRTGNALMRELRLIWYRALVDMRPQKL